MRSNQLSYRALSIRWLLQRGRKYNDPLRTTYCGQRTIWTCPGG